MKLSDWLADAIASLGIRHVFTLPGGFSMHINDSIEHHPSLEAVYMLHEAGAAIAAEAYAKIAGVPGCVVVTAGPGVTNALTGVAGAWLESTPMIVISGDVRTEHISTRIRHRLRQGGPQDVDAMPFARNVTSASLDIIEPSDVSRIKPTLARATAERPGPVWINVPLDMQPIDAQMDSAVEIYDRPLPPRAGDIDAVVGALRRASRPVILAGAGIECANAHGDFMRLIEALGVPALTTWPALDLVPYDHALFAGRPGTLAARGANWTIQRCDLLLVIGARCDVQTMAFDHTKVAPNARRFVVNIDRGELERLASWATPVNADAREFIKALYEHIGDVDVGRFRAWRAQVQEWKETYPFIRRDTVDALDTYSLVNILSDLATARDVIAAASSGQACGILLAGWRNKPNQRVIHASALGSMGFCVPGAIGACLASGKARTICVTSDGGFMQNMQELEVVRRLNLPIKFFVVNNGGYASIKASQQRAFGRLSGANADSGLTLPSAARIAEAFGIKAHAFRDAAHLRQRIEAILNAPGPALCEMFVPEDEVLAPCVMSRMGPDGKMMTGTLDDMWPELEHKS